MSLRILLKKKHIVPCTNKKLRTHFSEKPDLEKLKCIMLECKILEFDSGRHGEIETGQQQIRHIRIIAGRAWRLLGERDRHGKHSVDRWYTKGII